MNMSLHGGRGKWWSTDSDGPYFSGDTLGQDRSKHDLQTGEIILVLIDVETRVSTDITPKLAWIPVVLPILSRLVVEAEFLILNGEP